MRVGQGRAAAGPARRPIPSRAWPVRPLRLPGTTWRLREARGIDSRFDRLLGSRHGRDAAIRFPRKLAHSGFCRTRRSQIPPCSRGKLRRPTHPKTTDLHSFGDYCRGDEPQAGNGTQIYFKNSGARITVQTGVRQAGSLDPARRATRPRPSTRQGTSTRPQRVAQGNSARRNLGFPSKPTHPVIRVIFTQSHVMNKNGIKSWLTIATSHNEHIIDTSFRAHT